MDSLRILQMGGMIVSNNMLETELYNIQFEYKKILKNALENIYQKDSEAVIDEIGVFWERNRKIIQCILRYLFPPYSAYVFTSATILDLDDYEHFPFITLGKFHLWDDPIYKYVTMLRNVDVNMDFDQMMKRQIISTIEDNIKIIDQASGIIHILPIRLFTEANQLIYKAANQAFFSMFKEDINQDTYNSNFKTIGDIKNGLSPGVDKSIIFSEGEDNTVSLENRFRNYKDSADLPLPKDATDADIFWFAIFSYLAQAFDTILLGVEHKLVPYIRFEVAFKYVLIISPNFRENNELLDMLFKCAIAHVLHHDFDKSKIYGIDFRDYYEAIRKYDIEHKIFTDLKQRNLTFSKISLKEVMTITNNNFEKFFTQYHEK